MGVFKWLRRERITVSRCSISPATPPPEQSDQVKIGTIRTEEYKRDLAEFQARRSSGSKDLLETPNKKPKSGRHSLPCTGCTSASPDKSFNYEKKSASKYRKNKQRRTQEAFCGDNTYEVPNVQFLFQNQVFMPGNVFPASYSDPQKVKNYRRPSARRSPDFLTQKHLEFEDEGVKSPPLFFKNNSLPYDVKNFLGTSNSDVESLVERVGNSSHSDEVDSGGKFDSCESNLKEVMRELKNFDKWADDQLKLQLSNASDGNKSDTSIFGLPVVEINELDVDFEKKKQWSCGKWGAVPIRIKKLTGLSMERIRKNKNIEIEILKKYRHPNIILLMGFYPDIHQNIYLLCEFFIDTLFDVLHVKDSILTVQKSMEYTSDVASALLFLQMQGFIHTELNSSKIVITHHDAAKLADLGSCVKIVQKKKISKKYETYSLEPQYVNIESTYQMSSSDIEPLLTQRSSEVYLEKNAFAKPYYIYKDSEYYNWQAPEVYEPDEEGNVFVCSKSDVYSLSLVLWECCNASLPWKRFSYTELKDIYTKSQSAMPIPNDGTYPGAVLELLQNGLKINRKERWDLNTLAERLQGVKITLKDLPEIIIPSSSSKKKLNLNLWDSTSPSETDNLSPISQTVHKAVIHKTNQSSTDSEKESQANYEIYDESVLEIPNLKYLKVKDECPSSACSTPISKVTSRVKNFGTPGKYLHKSDSTEYCSILSPDRTNYINTDNSDNQSLSERVSAKFSKSFTPKSYKPLHIKVPDCNLDGIKTLCKDKSDSNMASTYSFDIKNYSLPNTPIARSNKLRKNAWLSGEIKTNERGEKVTSYVNEQESTHTAKKNDISKKYDSSNQCDDTQNGTLDNYSVQKSVVSSQNDQRIQDQSPGVDSSCQFQERFQSWPFDTMQSGTSFRSRIDDDALANMSVKPLVAIHERWIYEANKKNERSMSLPEDNRARAFRLKPASRRIEQLQQSLPQLYRRSSYDCRSTTLSASSKLGFQSTLTSSREFTNEEESKVGTIDRYNEYQRDKVDQSTDTRSIEEFIKDLIRTEFSQLMNEISDEINIENLVEKGTSNVLESLTNGHEEKSTIQSFSRIKINGNDKPLLRITFSNKGENCLEVLDNCVNVTIRDTNGNVKENRSEDTLTVEHLNDNSLKRCQAFSALQEARSTEDLYIDDDISTQMQENFGGKVKLIPLHGSLHEILCDKDDECCLVKVKQENGCDTIYFKCDNSDTESRDAVDAAKELPQDTVVYKRSISLVEERIQRVIPKKKKGKISIAKTRPKSEVFEQTFNKESLNRDLKVMSNSSPSLIRDFNEVQVNLDAMSYESSSDECLKCKAENDEFELLERKIEEDVKVSSFTNFPSGLEKISEENLSLLNDDFNDKCGIHGDSEM